MVATLVFFNDTATTEIYTLSLHDALPISRGRPVRADDPRAERPDPRPPAHPRSNVRAGPGEPLHRIRRDRKSTRLNSSHANISYAVFCLKKKRLRVLAAQFR